jgi:tetratricopeptide (TPR) repeat protein
MTRARGSVTLEHMLALVLASCFSQAPVSAPEAAAALARGDAAHGAFHLELAREEYERALVLEPASVDARSRLAHVLNDLGEEAASGKGHDAQAKVLFERALAIAEGLQRDAPGRPEGFHALAATLGNLTPYLSGPGKVRAARRIEDAATRATGLDPCLAPAYAVLAITYRELSSLGGFVRGIAQAALGGLPKGTLDDSEWLLRAAVALDPDDPFNRYQLALTLEREGQRRDAAAELERALALPAREPRDARNRADAEARLGRLRELDSSRR